MEVLGLGVDEVDLVFRLLASVLKLSNLTFLPRANIDGSEGSSLINEYGKCYCMSSGEHHFGKKTAPDSCSHDSTQRERERV